MDRGYGLWPVSSLTNANYGNKSSVSYKEGVGMDYITGSLPPSEEETYRKEYENKIRNKAIDDCIKILNTKEPKYYDILNDRYDVIEHLRELKK